MAANGRAKRRAKAKVKAPAAGRPAWGPDDIRPMPGEDAESLADRRDLLRAMARSDGFKLVGKLIRTLDEVDGMAVALLYGHGPGTGSPLARYDRHYDAGVWEAIDHFLYDLRGFTGTVEANLPPLPVE